MKVYTFAHPQIVLVISDNLAIYEYVKPTETVENAVRRGARNINKTSSDCYTRTPSLDYPPLTKPPAPPDDPET